MAHLENRLRLLAEWCQTWSRVADVGAGAGRLTRYLRDFGHEVVATEMSPAGWKILANGFRDDPGVTVLQGDGFLPLREYPVDAVVVAGMGPHTIAGILEHYEVLAHQPPILAQPMQGLWLFHEFLVRQRWQIVQAQFTLERGRIYGSWMLQNPEDSARLSPHEQFILREFRQDPLYCRVLQDRIERLSRHAAHQAGNEERLHWAKEEWRSQMCRPLA